MALNVWARFYFICDIYMCLVLMFLHDNVGGEHGTEEAKDWFRWRLCLVWVHVLAIYSKCESQKLERKGMELLSTFTKKKIFTNTSNPVIFIFHKVISETLRMANIINGVWRKALKDVEIKGQFLENAIFLGLCFLAGMILNCRQIHLWLLTGYSIPQGWCVLASFISVHMNEDNYENPYQFNPWRWEVRIN